MSIDPKLATEVAKIVAKEVYGDAFAPAAKEIGAGPRRPRAYHAGWLAWSLVRSAESVVIGIIGRAASQVPLKGGFSLHLRSRSGPRRSPI